MTENLHHESLEEEATHATDEARMLLPGVQAVLGFQLMAVFNQRFEVLTSSEQYIHFASFLMLALAMGLIMAPAAYHRQAERGIVSRQFVDLASLLLTIAMVPLTIGVALDTYLIGCLILDDRLSAALFGGGVALLLLALWFCLPAVLKRSPA